VRSPRVALVAVSLGVLFSACRGVDRSDVDPRVVSVWMRTMFGVIRVERLSPPVASRLLGYSTSALYSGLASTTRDMPSLAGKLNGLTQLPEPEPGRKYDGTITAVTAERVVLDTLLREALPTTAAAIGRLADSLENARMISGVSRAVRDHSVDLGRRIGLAIVAWSRTDGFDSTRGRPYVPTKGVGLWVNDAPGNTFAAQNMSGASEFVALDNPANLLQAGNASDRGLILNRPKRRGLATLPPVNIAGASEPYWGQVRPFVLTRWNECPLEEPPAFSTDTSSVLYQNAREVHAMRSGLTSEQRTIALYWADNAGESGTPVGHWISIASQLVSERRLSAPEAARLMVVTAVAQADAFIASWGYKYQFNTIRPRTYIRSVIDSTWEPLIPTPPFPEYPSGHSTQSAAAAAVIGATLGDAAFDDSTSLTIGHAVRRFESFGAAADEAGMSRLYGGIHFPIGNTSGQTLGKCVGAKVVERLQSPKTQP
jgi:hypothetical protein